MITEKAGAGFSFIPSKLIPCISVGTPILSICDATGPLGREVIENGLGLSLNWNQTTDLSDYLPKLGDLGFRSAVRENCLQRATIYARDVAISNYETLLRDLADARSMATE